MFLTFSKQLTSNSQCFCACCFSQDQQRRPLIKVKLMDKPRMLLASVSSSFQAHGRIAFIFCPLKSDMATRFVLVKRKGCSHFQGTCQKPGLDVPPPLLYWDGHRGRSQAGASSAWVSEYQDKPLPTCDGLIK